MNFSELNFSDDDFAPPAWLNLSHRDFEFDGWQRLAESYGRSFETVTRLYGSKLLDAVAAAPTTRILDVACGTGLLTSLAASRGEAAH